ncbi:hypothetical protein MBLNU457_g2678t1 [Dothideomycetes sp. NU457]
MTQLLGMRDSVPDDAGKALVPVAWSLFCLACIIVCLRIWTRLVYLRNRIAIHDWLMVLAIIFELVHTSLVTVARSHGLGLHVYNLSQREAVKTAEYIIGLEGFGLFAGYFARMSFATFLLEVIGVTAMPRRYTLLSLITLNTISNLITFTQIYSQCGTHLSALTSLDKSESLMYCTPVHVQVVFTYVNSACNTFTDLALTVVVLSIVWTLTLPWKTKFALYTLLTFSYFAIASSIATVVKVKLLAESKDFTYHFAPLEVCLICENDIVIIAASLPMLRVLWNGRHPTSTHPSTGLDEPDASRMGSISSALNRSRRRDTATISMHVHDQDEEKGGLRMIPELATHGLVPTLTAESEAYKGPGVSVKSSVGSAEHAQLPENLMSRA